MNNIRHYYIDEEDSEMPPAKRRKQDEALIDYEFEEDKDVFQLSLVPESLFPAVLRLSLVEVLDSWESHPSPNQTPTSPVSFTLSSPLHAEYNASSLWETMGTRPTLG